MSITVGALTRLYDRWPLERALEGIARCGIRVVGVWEGPRDEPVFPGRPAPGDVARVAGLLDRYGLTPALLTQRLDIGRSDGLATAVQVAADLGTGLLGVVPVPGPLAGDAERAWLEGALDAAIGAGEARHVRIAIKPHRGITGTGPALARLVERLGESRLSVLYDPGNVLEYEGASPEEDIGAVARYTAAVCAKDHVGPVGSGSFPIPGDGDVDFTSIFRTLRAAGFSGNCFLERIDGASSPEDVDRALLEARIRLELAATRARTP